MILLMTLQDGPVIGIEDNERYVINNNKDIISDKRPTSPEVLSHQKSFQHLRKGDNIYYYGRGYGGVYIL
jgi:hypothetical protein